MKRLAIAIILALEFGFGPGAAFAQQKVRRNVQIEFEPVEGASIYEIQVKRKDGSAEPTRFKTKKPIWEATIKPGTYDMQIRSFDSRGAPGEWSPPTEIKVKLPAIIVKQPEPGAVIKAPDMSSQTVRLAWESIPGANGYKVEVKGDNNSFSADKDVGSPAWTVDLTPGHEYTWNVSAIDHRGQAGEVSEGGYKFELRGPPLKKPRIAKPISKYVKQLTWSAPDHATHYSYELTRYNSSTKKWDPVESGDNLKENKLNLDVTRPSGRYFLSVQAHAPYWEPSEKGQMEFYMQGGFRDNAAFENAIIREGLAKPTKFYAIASYLVTRVNYSSQNHEYLSSPQFDAFGGTGRLGAGYQDQKSNWGGFGIVDLSGFIIENQNFTFASGELHATRKLELGQKGLFQFATGFFFKEIPIVGGTTFGGYEGVGKVTNYGPHAGFVYWWPFSQRLGLQANARTYYTLLGSAPGGREVQSSLSYQLGALGSYRLARSWMGYAGYAYRRDEAVFTALVDPTTYAQAGQINTISIQGHYLNLILEWSF